MADIAFTPVSQADLPLIEQWLHTDHWRAWWSTDSATELGYIRDMIEGRDSARPYLIRAGGEPVGYIQSWRVGDAKVEPWLTEAPWLAHLPDHAVGVDLSIGPGALLSRGIGSQALRAFVAGLRAGGHDDIIIDPDPRNLRAIRAYEKAGFRPMPEFAHQAQDCLLMRHHEKGDQP